VHPGKAAPLINESQSSCYQPDLKSTLRTFRIYGIDLKCAVQYHEALSALILVVGHVRVGDEGIFITDEPVGMLIPRALQASSDLVLGGPMNLALTMV
jgi:hypothetical protein